MTISVLLVDDHTIVREGLSSLLNSVEGITVVGDAADGRMAIAETQRLEPDVVVMDIAMPELNGISATEQICRVRPATGIVILSVYFSLDHISMALKAGAKGYLLKGSASGDVVDAIRAVHAGQFYLSREIVGVVVKEYIVKEHAAAAKGPLSNLTAREREILQMVVEGKSNTYMAEILGVTRMSMEVYRSRLLKKLGTKDRGSLLLLAVQHGLTTL
jgi:DNA-binding NarL/FixJ family response regulator